MFQKLRLPLLLLLGAALTVLSPGAVQAKRHEQEREHHRSRFSFSVGVQHGYVAPGYYPRYYAGGYYDRWGYWHPYRHHRHPYPYGYYDAWGYWHP